MKKRFLLFTAMAGMGYLFLSSYAAGPARNGYDCTGAEDAGTGNYANYTGCQVPGSGCHSTAATSTIAVVIELDSAGVATTHYKGGMSYTVKITGTNTGAALPKYGFQLAAMKGSSNTVTPVADAGVLSAAPTGTHLTAPGSYTYLTIGEHSSAISLGGGSTFTHTFTWTAPTAGTGTISFWGAANFVNGNGNADNSDLWNTNHIAIDEWPASTGVATVANNISVTAYPNPVINSLNLQMDNTQTGTYSLQVFDNVGRTVAAEKIAVNGANHIANINTANWAAGNYHIVVEKDGNRQVISVVKK